MVVIHGKIAMPSASRHFPLAKLGTNVKTFLKTPSTEDYPVGDSVDKSSNNALLLIAITRDE